MSDTQGRTSRRSFFVQGGAVIGAGLATAGTALAGTTPAAGPNDGGASDREAIRCLQSQFLRHVSAGNHAAAATLFHRDARLELDAPAVRGSDAIATFFATRYAGGETVVHGGYRRTPVHPDDVIHVAPGGATASATFVLEAELCTPLQDTCTVAQMARLQGNVASRRWQPGRFDVHYARAAGRWEITDLRWSAI